MWCGSCGRECPADARFCSQCGSPLTGGAAPEPARRAAAAEGAEAERRLLHVMFCDVVGSTSFSEQVDAEDYRKVLREYYGICGDAVEHYGGYVAKHLGDGVLIFFGYPDAHKDDARRAVLAALEISVAVPRLRWMTSSDTVAQVSTRIGIHTGLTVVGEVGEGPTYEALAVGATTNIAARLQQLAVAGEVVVSDATRRLIDRDFELRSVGEHQLKGVSEPMRVYRVLGSVDRPKSVLPDRFVGRRYEIERIGRALREAEGGHECVVSIGGAPGVGKSRLVEAVREGLARTDVNWVSVDCSPFYRNTPLAPLVQLVRSEAGVSGDDDDAATMAKLDALLGRVGVDHHEARSLLAALVGIDAPGDALEYPSEVRKRRTLELLAEVLRGLASDRPAVVVLEDLQWADPTTRELLGSMIEAPSAARLLVVVTHRPDAAWPSPSHHGVVEVALEPLAAEETEALIRRLTADTRLPDDVVQAIVTRADGVPLFVEELVRAAHESALDGGSSAPSIGTIPVTLHGALTEQLDRLRPSKRVAQLGAMLGRRFSVEVLAELVAEPSTLEPDLDRLVEAGIVVPVTKSGRPAYEFRHALVQEAAYDSLLRSDRRRLHGQIAAVLEAHYPDEVDTHPEVVGQHWQRAGQHRQAARHLERAAARSAADHANEEALAFYGQALASLRAVLAEEPGSEWVDTVVAVHERRGEILTLLRRPAEAEAAYRTALERSRDAIGTARLHRRIGIVHEQRRRQALDAFAEAEAALGAEDAERAAEWRREWIGIHLARMRVHYWYDEADEMVAIERRIAPFIERDATSLQRAEFFDQVTLMNFRRERYAMSDQTLDSAAQYVEAAEAAGDLTELASARFTFAFSLVFSGRPDEAITQLDGALDLSRRCGHRTIEIRCLAYLGTAHRLAGRVDQAEQFSTDVRTTAAANDMVEYVGVACANLAWVALVRGRHAEATRWAAEAVEAWDRCGMAWPFRWLGLLPRLATAHAAGEDTVVAGCAAAMLEPAQQLLPPRMVESLQRIVAAAERADGADIRQAAAGVLDAAAKLGLLGLLAR